MKNNNTDVFISGGSLSGLIASIAFAKNGFSVVCVDKNNPEFYKKTKKNTFRTTAFLEPSKRFLDEIGIWKYLEKYSCPMQSLKIVDTIKSNNKLDIKTAKTFSNDNYSIPLGWNIKNSDMLNELYKVASKDKNIRFHSDTAIQEFETLNDYIELKLTNGSQYRSKLLIGSDGKDSFVRNKLKIKSISKNLKQSALTFGIEHDYNHENISNEIYSSGGPFTTVPLGIKKDGTISSVVWMDSENNADKLINLERSELEKKANERSANILGKLKIISDPHLWKMQTQVATRLISYRTAIIAEAAHVIPPIGAQGFNMSINDIKCLLKKSLDPSYKFGETRMLLSYERERFIDMNLRVGSVNLLNRVSRTDNQIIKNIRSKSIDFLFNFKPLKSSLMRFGLGSK